MMPMKHNKKESASQWRSLTRDAVASFVAFIPVALIIAEELELDNIPKLAGLVAVLSAFNSALLHPTGQKWLSTLLGGNGEPDVDYQGKHRLE